MSARSASSTAGIRAPALQLVRVEPDVGGRGRQQRRIVEQAAEHRPHAQRGAAAAPRRRARCSRAATTARQAGSDENVRAYGRGSIGIPYLRCRPGAPSASLASSPGSSVSTIMFSRQRSWSP